MSDIGILHEITATYRKMYKDDLGSKCFKIKFYCQIHVIIYLKFPSPALLPLCLCIPSAETARNQLVVGD